MLISRPEIKCNQGGRCDNENCPFAHPSPLGSGSAGPDSRICKYGSKCSRPVCKYAHASPAAYRSEKMLAKLGNKVRKVSELSPVTTSLLRNFQEMFHVDLDWIKELESSLEDISCKVALIFVDLDNVPRFFEQITPQMISQLPFETFIVCSANSPRHCPRMISRNVHFSLANVTKDAADAICTVAAAKLDSILVQFGRRDVPLIVVSDDKIFSQVHDPQAVSNCCRIVSHCPAPVCEPCIRPIALKQCFA